MTEAMVWNKPGMASVKEMPVVQDGLPPGGFAPVRYTRRIPTKGPSAATIFLTTFGAFAWSLYQVGQGNKACRRPRSIFRCCLPTSKYYLVDVGYPNRPGYLAPYKGERYHVPEFRRGVATSGEKEKFNHLHSSVRNVIERSFGIWKMKWIILLKMPSFLMSKQKMIVAATMGIHNIIREHASPDMHFHRFDRDPNYVPTIPLRYAKYVIFQDASDASTSQTSATSMDSFHDDLGDHLHFGRGQVELS